MSKQEEIKQWSRLYGRQITEEEYKEICDNLSGFFKILYEWDKAEKEKKVSTNKEV
ncbi:MAG: hypothetical protein M0R20_03635 [Candidatus Omnitrophica bacterium]|jgi:hypothetical protein|nr:hypothetical protein [Candidatus Omnitrophota bacterium]